VFFQLRPTAEMVKELTEETRTSAERVRKLKQDRASTRTTSGLRLRAAPAGEHVFSQSVTTLGAPRTRVARLLSARERQLFGCFGDMMRTIALPLAMMTIAG